MTDLLSALKNFGGLFGKGIVIESFIEYYGDDLVAQLKQILDNAGIKPEDIREYVLNDRALPIPPQAFAAMKGLEDYLITIEEARIFEFLAKARPDLAAELINLGDLGAEWVARFKYFIIDSVKASRKGAVSEDQEPLQEPLEKPQKPKMKRVTCSECEESFTMTEEEVNKLTSCPSCGAPTNT